MLRDRAKMSPRARKDNNSTHFECVRLDSVRIRLISSHFNSIWLQPTPFDSIRLPHRRCEIVRKHQSLPEYILHLREFSHRILAHNPPFLAHSPGFLAQSPGFFSPGFLAHELLHKLRRFSQKLRQFSHKRIFDQMV